MSILKKQYRIFISEMKKHGDATIAYKKAYPSVKETTARVNGYKLLQIATISDEITKAVTKRQKRIDEANDIIEIEDAKESTKQGLKSKFERVMEYQHEITRMYEQLTGSIKFTFKVGNSIKHSHAPDGTFMVPIDVQNDIRTIIKVYKAEISKIEGDYASNKTEITGPNGQPLQTESTVLILPSNGYELNAKKG